MCLGVPVDVGLRHLLGFSDLPEGILAEFVQPDPTDHLSDDELWEMMPESIRKSGA